MHPPRSFVLQYLEKVAPLSLHRELQLSFETRSEARKETTVLLLTVKRAAFQQKIVCQTRYKDTQENRGRSASIMIDVLLSYVIASV